MYTITGHMGWDAYWIAQLLALSVKQRKTHLPKIQTSHVYWKWKPYSPTMILLAYHKHPHSPANCFSFEYVFVLFTYQTGRLCVPSNGITVQLSSSMWDISEAQLELPVVKV